MFRNPWPIDEHLKRYDRNVFFSGKIYGDLAIFMGDQKYRFEKFVRFQTDELGFRNNPRERFDENLAVVLGDSFGAGSGGSQEVMLSSVLEERYGVTNYNLSVGGASPWAELMTLKHEIQNISVEPNGIMLWLLFSGNDLDDSFRKCFDVHTNGRLRQLLIRAENFRFRSPVLKMLRRNVDRSHLVKVQTLNDQQLLFYTPYIERVNRTEDEIKAHENYSIFQQIFDEMYAFCLSYQLRLYVVLVPSKSETYSWVFRGSDGNRHTNGRGGLSEVLLQWCEPEGIPFLDLTPHFKWMAEHEWRQNGRLLYWRDDTHWNDLGQHIAASCISEMIRARNSSIPSPEQRSSPKREETFQEGFR
jgi:hypothetical protein